MTWIVVAAVAGLLLGPLLRAQVFVHTVPAGESWRRDCPHCAARLNGAFLPPTGRCPHCRGRIGPPPGVVEVVAAVALAVVAWRVHEPLPLLAVGWVALFGVVLAHVDVAVHRLPDRLTFPAAGGALVLFGLSAVVGGEWGRLASAVACAAALAAFYLVLVLVSPNGMGFGDAKAALCVGLVAGWFGWGVAVAAALAGFLLAGLYATALLLLRRVGRKDHIAHGPFLLLGVLAAIAALG
ncbi:prepilin peptidase [Phytohabitans sp. ZYX-F-186]|uniref:Prepilin peptidase n=1 Tax=Phytohabitans maris TaxID=3071409 RepID=A0ABU0ZEI0_9ACTN|nr:prepilin peptidase [Phytohabitans sp. ZYX-F-186]MDQ7905442.1 prepilin peptidase [Phytohabitans sp. ZYX-F-186]